MNLKTTLALLVLVAAGFWLLWYNPSVPRELDPLPQPPAGSDAGTREVLDQLRHEEITRIEVRRAAGDRTVLERNKKGAWELPGGWPPRSHEVEELVQALGTLRSRFEPEPLANIDALADYGLTTPKVTVILNTKSATHNLDLGEKPEDEVHHRFSRPTYLRLDDRSEVVRVTPGLVALLDRPTDYYQQRRLFPFEPAAGDTDRPGAEQLAAQKLIVNEEKAEPAAELPGQPPAPEKKEPVHYTLVRDGKTWSLSQPVKDRLDPDRSSKLLAAVPDIWAERFVRASPAGAAVVVALPAGDLSTALTSLFWLTDGQPVQMGLDHPRQRITVDTGGKKPITLLVGGQAVPHERREVMPPMPGMPPGMPPQSRTVFDRYRYARLQDNDQVFEVRDDRLQDVFVSLDSLRDAQVARFNASDVQQLTIRHEGETIELKRDKEGKDDWRLLQPFQADADRDKISDLLTRLAGLRASGKDILDGANPSSYGLEHPRSTITLTVLEEKKSGDTKTKEPRTITLLVGKHDSKDKKLYVQLAGWPRIDSVEDSLAPLADRQALAYRGKRVLDFRRDDLARIDITEGKESFALLYRNSGWRLEAPQTPSDTEADVTRGDRLADKLGKLEASEYVDESPKADDLAAKYGLKDPATVVKVSFTDSKKPARTLRVGKAHLGKNGSKDGRYAQVEGTSDRPAPVFVVGDDLYQDLTGGSLVYRPLQLWILGPESITDLRIRKGSEPEYELTRDGQSWKIHGPFDAPALAATVKKMTEDLSEPRCERYVRHAARGPEELAEFGLDKPYLEVTLHTKGKERSLVLGKPVSDRADRRYAMLGKGSAIVEVGPALIGAADHTALGLLDPVLLQIDPKTVRQIHSQAGKESMTLEPQADGLQVTESPAGKIRPDPLMTGDIEAVWINLVADHFAAYGDKVQWQEYGLDRPAFRVTVKADREHVVELGKPVDGRAGSRYARVDHGPGVAVLPPHEAGPLTRTYLDFVNRTILKLGPDGVTRLERRMGDDTLELDRTDMGWQVRKPAEETADEPTLQDLLTRLGELRAQRIAAYPASDLASYGLDSPSAVWTIQLKEGKPHQLKVGKPADDTGGERYVQVDDGKVIAVLPGKLSRQLTAAPLAYRDRSLAQFVDADHLQLERGRRRAVFARLEGTWKLAEPFPGEAAQSELDDFLNSLAKLRADELVADRANAATLKKYGLERPTALWTVQLGAKKLLQLAIGSADGRGRRHARLGDNRLVFLLDPQLSERVLAEYRPRTVWKSPLDASQVESLHYGYREEKPFTLERKADTWSAVGKSDARINTATVNETLEALAGLKLLRYVEDQGADRKIYGLETPYLSLEVATSSGKRALRIGNNVGQSRQRYACLPDSERADVFVLDEDTCARLLRDLPAFGRSPPAGSTGSVPPPPTPP